MYDFSHVIDYFSFIFVFCGFFMNAGYKYESTVIRVHSTLYFVPWFDVVHH